MVELEVQEVEVKEEIIMIRHLHKVETVNTGSGGGGCGKATPNSGAGGKGVIILSMADGSHYSGTTSGSPTVATGVSGKTVLTFNGSGSYTT